MVTDVGGKMSPCRRASAGRLRRCDKKIMLTPKWQKMTTVLSLRFFTRYILPSRS